MNGQVVDMAAGLVETLGEEPELELDDTPDRHEEEEEELTKVSSVD